MSAELSFSILFPLGMHMHIFWPTAMGSTKAFGCLQLFRLERASVVGFG